ncbi:MAG: GNAT family N-acetyltransferase [Kineosporiaceae bacterium]|jgi:predicted GNAT family acetyltransferase
MSDIDVRHNPDAQRYEGYVDGVLAGFTAYTLSDALIAFDHTEVDAAYEGKGVGSAIARFALDDVRSVGERQVVPVCPFIRRWIERHPDYAAVVYPPARID